MVLKKWKSRIMVCMQVCAKNGVEKIKTIGDCYMCVAWRDDIVVESDAAICSQVMNVAQAMHQIISMHPFDGVLLAIRAGMNCGPAVSGIIGKNKFCFDLWGVCFVACGLSPSRSSHLGYVAQLLQIRVA